MKVFYISDIHLEGGIGNLEIPECDVLLLAGDIMSPAMAFHNRCLFPIKKNLTDKIQKRYQKFFHEVSRKAKHTYYICGNHEYYGTTVSEAKEMIYDFISPHENIHFLDNQHVEIGNDVWLFGGTLWTDLDRHHPMVELKVRKELNDYRYIFEDDYMTPIHITHFYDENQRCRDSIEKFLKDFKDKKTIVMTHHAPSWECVIGEYRDTETSFAYANSGMDWMLYDIGPDFWIHGHMHKRDEIQITDRTKILCNARGYFAEKLAKTGKFNQLFI